MAIIYKAINKENQKAYIGYDSNWPRRKRDHINAAKRGVNWLFEKALRKHGEEAFEWSIIKEDATFQDEIDLIHQHNTFYLTGHGYNLTLGGEGKLGHKHSPETKKLLSEKAKQRELTPEILQTLRNNAEKMRGVPRSQEIRDHLSRTLKDRKFSEKHLENIRKNNSTRDKSWMLTEEYRLKMSQSKSGEIRTDNTKTKISDARKNGKWYTNGTKTKFLQSDQPIPDGYRLGRK